MNLKGLYKSASYQNTRQSYVQDKKKLQNKSKGNLEHLVKYNENIVEEKVVIAPKPPVKDYLSMMRVQRMERESKQSS
jgi:hypothetical protein